MTGCGNDYCDSRTYSDVDIEMEALLCESCEQEEFEAHQDGDGYFVVSLVYEGEFYEFRMVPE